MAKGTPVVASKHAAIPEVIKDKKTGFLFNEKDVDSLTELLRKILEDEFDLNSIRGNARSLIEKKYSVSRLVQEVEQIYDHVSA
jgi:glycosyltransferase involved in cell wall biosynthesis